MRSRPHHHLVSGAFTPLKARFRARATSIFRRRTPGASPCLERSPERPTNHFSVPRRIPGASPFLERSPERSPGHLSFPQEDSQSHLVPRAQPGTPYEPLFRPEEDSRSVPVPRAQSGTSSWPSFLPAGGLSEPPRPSSAARNALRTTFPSRRRTPGASPFLERSPERPPGHLSFPQEDSQSHLVPRAISSP